MRWLQDNPFIACMAAATAVGAAIVVYFLTQSLGQFKLASESYAVAVERLHGLQNRSPFPNKQNFEKNSGLAATYTSELSALRDLMLKMEAPPLPDVRPQQFQDDLRTAVNKTAEKASAAGVELPKDFYLGFGQYSNSLPTERAAPALARQLSVIDQLVSRLIDFKVHSINELNRQPLPEEALSENAKRGTVERYPFDLAFTAEQAKFRVVFNSLLGTDLFLIVRALHVQNDSPAPPSIAKPERYTTSPSGGPPATLATQAADLDVILGREMVKVTMRIEMLDFADPNETKK